MAVDLCVLTEIIELEELKRSTDVTRNVISSAQTLVKLQTEEERAHISSLLTSLRSCFQKMINSVGKCKLLSSKLDKLWVLFHEFTTREGNKLCRKCDGALKLQAHDVLWQLIMEKEFMLKVKELRTTASSDVNSSPRKLTNVEENAIRYASGFVIRKLLTKYCKKRTQKEVEWSRVLNEMASKVSRIARYDNQKLGFHWLIVVVCFTLPIEFLNCLLPSK